MSERSRRFRFGGFEGVARPMRRCQMCEVHTVAGHAIAGGRTGGADFAIGEFLRNVWGACMGARGRTGRKSGTSVHGLGDVGQGIVTDCGRSRLEKGCLDGCRWSAVLSRPELVVRPTARKCRESMEAALRVGLVHIGYALNKPRITSRRARYPCSPCVRKIVVWRTNLEVTPSTTGISDHDEISAGSGP